MEAIAYRNLLKLLPFIASRPVSIIWQFFNLSQSLYILFTSVFSYPELIWSYLKNGKNNVFDKLYMLIIYMLII